MPYAIQTEDKPGTAEIRAEYRAIHLEYYTAYKDKLLAAGALIDDEDTAAQGSLVIIDTDDRAEAERFIAEEPYTKAGLFAKITVTCWRKGFFNKERLI